MSAEPSSGRRTPSLPLTDTSTLAPSPRARHHPSSSTLAASSTAPSLLHSSSFRSTPLSWGRRAHTPKKSGGFLLESGSVGSSTGSQLLSQFEREREYATHRERGAGHGRDRDRVGHGHPRVRGEAEAEGDDDVPMLPDFPAHFSDTGPAKIVSLALGLSETRRKGSKARSVSSMRRLRDIADEGSASSSNDPWLMANPGIVPQAGARSELSSTGSRGREFPATSSFLVGGNTSRRSVSMGTMGAVGRQPSPLNPISPPPPAGGAAGKQSFPPISPLPLLPPTAPYQQLQPKRSALGQLQQLREFREEYQPTEATLLRALKAKQQLELSALYKKLLTICPPQETTVGGTGGPTRGITNKGDGSVGSSSKERAYNPLMAIRNKRFRTRERIKLELSSWDDPGAVEQWIEDVAVAAQEHADNQRAGLPPLPPPPHPTGRVEEKRAKMDWVITPQELLAGFYWMEETERVRMQQAQQAELKLEEQKKREKQRESHLSLKSLIEREDRRVRGSSQYPKRSLPDLRDEELGGEIVKRRSTEDGGKKRMRPAAVERHRSLRSGAHADSDNGGYQSAYTSQDDSSRGSDSGGVYDEVLSEMEVDSDLDHKVKKKHSKRRALGKIITGAKPGRGKRKPKQKRANDTYILDPDERRKKQEQEEIAWMAEVGNVGSRLQKSYSTGEDIVLSTPLDKSTSGRKTETRTGIGLPEALEERGSSLERPNSTGLPTSRKSLDFTEIVVPSIAISLIPPKNMLKGEDHDADPRGRAKRKEDADMVKDEKRKASPTKKLLEKGKEALGREKDTSLEDRHRESLEIDVSKKGKDKEASTMNRVKSRVGKLRSEVAGVGDFIWRKDGEKGGSALSSPTGSSFAEADSTGYRSDDGQAGLTREDKFSGSEDERKLKRPQGRASLEVPDAGPSGSTSGGRRPTSAGFVMPAMMDIRDDHWDLSSDDEPNGERKSRSSAKFDTTRSYISRDPSPVKTLNTQPINDRNGMAIGERAISMDRGLAGVVSKDGKPLAVTAKKQELMRARAYLLASGVVARGITTKRTGTAMLGRVSRNTNGKGVVVLAKQQMYSAAATSREISDTEKALAAKSEIFTHSTVTELRRLINGIKEEVEGVLAPMLGEVADGADELNGELTTKCTLAVKSVNDDLSNVMRRKRRRFRWVRRAGYVMLEWVVLGVMWWVWLVVVVVRILRVTLTGAIRGVRWILWI